MERYKKILSGSPGNVGTFYYGWDNELDKPVGIKEMHNLDKILNEDNDRQLLLNEILLSTCIPQYSNLVTCNDVIINDKSNAKISLIIEVVAGESLKEKIENFKINSLWIQPENAVSIISQIIQALLFLREVKLTHIGNGTYDNIISKIEGIDKCFLYHGDIHEGNIIITEDERAVLIDWGQTYRIPHRRKMFANLPPELFYGNTDIVYRGEKSDVYCIAYLLFYLLTKQLPFKKDDLDLNEINAITRYYDRVKQSEFTVNGIVLPILRPRELFL